MAAVADLLKIAYPSTFDVHQTLNNNNCTCSTTTNNSETNNILSLTSNSQLSTTNRSASIYKIGRETSVNIQSLIDTQPKLCRYCSQNLISENLLKKRLNELPINLRDSTQNSEPFIYFCNEQCFNTYITNTQQQPTISTNIKNEPMDVILSSCLKRREQNLNEAMKRWKRWNPDFPLKTNIQLSNTNEIDQLSPDIQFPLSLNANQDKRICVFCNGIGDMSSNGPGRLLNLDIGHWCHLNCALWSYEVYETVSGALMCVEQAFTRSINTECVICKQKGSSLTCFYQRCPNTYHYTCAIENGCIFYKNKVRKRTKKIQ
jgi:histone-lysine N-methyltransferase MLL3